MLLGEKQILQEFLRLCSVVLHCNDSRSFHMMKPTRESRNLCFSFLFQMPALTSEL